MKKLDIYILAELLGPFIFGVAAFSSIMIGSNLLFEVARFMVDLNMPTDLVGKIMLLELPGIVVLTFPMSTLLATLLSFGRLSGNSEIIAFKAGGVSFTRMVIPVVIVGLLVSLVTIYINERVVPFTEFESRRLQYEFKYNNKIPLTQTHLSLTQLDSKTKNLDYLLYAKTFDGESQSMTEVSYYDYDDGRIISITQAKEARWLNSQWVFYNGEIKKFSNDGGPVVNATFSQYEMKDLQRSPQNITLTSNKKLDSELTLEELREKIDAIRKSGKDTKKLLVTYYQRFSIPFSCLIFALIGAPLGLQPNRSGSSIGLGLSIIVIFIYYIVLTVGGTMGQSGLLPPMIGAWLPNIIFAVLGFSLNYKMSN